jgi:hypothetical protein
MTLRIRCAEVNTLAFRALEPMTMIGGPAKGMRDWMMEVQICELPDASSVLVRHMFTHGVVIPH